MKRLSKIGMVILSICILMLGGCAGQEPEPTPGQTEDQATPVEKEPVLQEMDWASQFEGLEGAAVMYIPEEERYLVSVSYTHLWIFIPRWGKARWRWR